MNQLLHDLYDYFYSPPELSVQKQEIRCGNIGILSVMSFLSQRHNAGFIGIIRRRLAEQYPRKQLLHRRFL